MKSLLRATAILGSSSLFTVVVGVLAAKAWAVLLGPTGLGLMSLYQSLIGIASIITGMGIGAGFVQIGAKALGQNNKVQVAALRQATWILFWLLSGLGVIVLAMFRVVISRWMLGSPMYASSVVLMAPVLLCNVAFGVHLSTLNAYHCIKALAKVNVLNSFLGTAVSLAVVAFWHEKGIPAAIAVNTIIIWAITWHVSRRTVERLTLQPTPRDVRHALRQLISFGVPYTASILVGAGVQLVLPSLVLHHLGQESVGFYRAAIAVSINYLGFLISAMTQDYRPRVAAASNHDETLVLLVNQQYRLAILLATPLIFGALGIAPMLIPLIYSPHFLPVVEVLEWQLIGDLFKFTGWTMALVVLARSGSLLFFCTELGGGMAQLIVTWLSIQWFGIAGAGIGYLARFLVYYLIVWPMLRQQIGLVWTTSNKRLMGYSILGVVSVRAMGLTGFEELQMPASLSLALITGIGSAFVLQREMRNSKDGPVL